MEQTSDAPALRIRSPYLYHNAPAGDCFNSLALCIVRSLLTTFLPSALMDLTRMAVCIAAFVNLVNSLTHIFVIRTGRPVVLGAVVGVGTIWMLVWLGTLACQIMLTWISPTWEHTICDYEYMYSDHYKTLLENECKGYILGYACALFTVLGL